MPSGGYNSAEADSITNEQEDFNTFYDLVVNVNSFESVLKRTNDSKKDDSERGWEVTTDLKKIQGTGVDSAIRFAIIGDFKKGKTWLLSKLSDHTLNHSKTVHTPGLCWKRLDIRKVPCILMDSKGENSPVTSITPKSLNDRRAEEYILRDILCKMSDAFIFMVNSIGMHEQRTLQSLCVQLAKKNQFSRVIVVHNLKQIKTKKQFQNAIAEIQATNEGEGYENQEQDIEINGEVRTVKKFKKGTVRGMREAVPQTHFVLGSEDGESGEDNPWVLEAIKQQFLHIGAVKREGTLITQLEDTIIEAIPQYLNSNETIESKNLKIDRTTTPKGTTLLSVSGLPEDVTLRSFGMDDYVPAGGTTSFTSAAGASWRISTMQAVGGEREKVKVEIKLPGYSEEQLAKDLNPSYEDEDQENKKPPILKIEDNSDDSVGYKITLCPALIDNKYPLEDIYRETWGFDPTSHEEIPIEVRERVEMDGMEAYYEEGIVVLIFLKGVGGESNTNDISYGVIFKSDLEKPT